MQPGGSPCSKLWRKENSQQLMFAPRWTHSYIYWTLTGCNCPSTDLDLLIFGLFQPVALKTAGSHLVACQGPTVLRKRKGFGVWSLLTLIKCCAGLKGQEVSAIYSLHEWSRRASSFPARVAQPGWANLPVLAGQIFAFLPCFCAVG